MRKCRINNFWVTIGLKNNNPSLYRRCVLLEDEKNLGLESIRGYSIIFNYDDNGEYRVEELPFCPDK